MIGNLERRLQALTDRLEVSKSAVDELVAERQDRVLTSAFESGAYGRYELDLLFEFVEKPLATSVVSVAGSARAYGRYEFPPELGTDVFFRSALMLAQRMYFQAGDENRPAIDLLSSEMEDRALGIKGAAQLGLIRRLIRRQGIASLEDRIASAAVEPDRVSYLKVKSKHEVERLLRLMAPIERDHPFDIITFQSPTGRTVGSKILPSGGQTVPSYYMGVDK